MSIEKNASTGVHKTASNGLAHTNKSRAAGPGGAGAAGDTVGGFAATLFALDAPQADTSFVDPGQVAGGSTVGQTDAMTQAPGTLGVMPLPVPAAVPGMADGAGVPAQASSADTVSTLSLGGAASRHGVAVTGAFANPAADAETAARALFSKDQKPGRDGMENGPQAIGDQAVQAQVAPHKPVDAVHGAKALADAAQSGRSEATDTASLAAVEAMIKKMASAADAAEGGARDVRSGLSDLASGASSQTGQGAFALHPSASEAGPGSSFTYSASPTNEAGLLTPEAQMTEQMSYCVSRDVQNAQLRLDGFGADGVEVNITLQGKEAQVDFRTDMPEAREALEGASAQLKDMLSREGLVLSGVSVGTSAQGQAQTSAQQRKDQQAARQARVSAPTSASERGALQALAAPVRTSAGSLDLFV